MAIDSELYLDNDFLVSLGPVFAKARTNATAALLSGATVRCWIAATDARTAAPINAALDFTLTEDGTTGTYHIAIDGSLLTTHLASYVDQLVWFHFSVNTNDYRARASTTVRAVREA